jgi:acyl-coenzyme A thioesterase PaaI-like protein
MKPLTRFKWMLWSFGKTKVPLIGYVRPQLLEITDERIVIKLPCNKRNKNHLNSMYFGALSIGADLAAGFHGLYHAKQSKKNVSLAFKAFEAQFVRRPESDVYFVSEMGHVVQDMIKQTTQTKTRVNQWIDVIAYTHYPDTPEAVANFKLELSLKVLR